MKTLSHSGLDESVSEPLSQVSRIYIGNGILTLNRIRVRLIVVL